MCLPNNIGMTDRIIRCFIGFFMVYIAFYFQLNATVFYVLSITGLLFVITGFFGFCSVYSLFKINTNK